MDWNQRLDGHPKQRGKEEANKAFFRELALQLRYLYIDIATALKRAHPLSLYVDFGVALIDRKSSN